RLPGCIRSRLEGQADYSSLRPSQTRGLSRSVGSIVKREGVRALLVGYPPNVVLISTYELGRQPFGLASPAAWLRRAGARVTCLDLSREPLREEPVRQADLIAFYVPMHTVTRLAVEVLPAVRKLNPRAHLCFYGLYAPVNESLL